MTPQQICQPLIYINKISQIVCVLTYKETFTRRDQDAGASHIRSMAGLMGMREALAVGARAEVGGIWSGF